VEGRRVEVIGRTLPAFVAGAEDAAMGMVAPILEGEDFDGTPVRIGGTSGDTRRLVVFLSHRCDDCAEQAESLAGWLRQDAVPENVEVTVVATQTDDARAGSASEAFLEAAGLGGVATLVDDDENHATEAYGITRLPTSVMLLPDNSVFGRLGQNLPADYFETLADALSIVSADMFSTTTTPEDTSTTTEPVPETTIPTSPPPTEPPPTNPPPAEVSVESLIGEPIDGAVVSQFLAEHACEVDYHYKCLSDGIEMSLGGGLAVESVFLYAEGIAGFAQYTGTLPFDLTWGTTRAQVEAALGAPTASGDLTEYESTHFSVYDVTGATYRTLTLSFDLADGSPGAQQLQQVTMTRSPYQPL
jgi:hypothetical protein